MSDAQRLSDDIDSEIADHLARRVRDLCVTGMTEADARAQAGAEFGDVSTARRQLLTIDARIERRRRPRIWSGVGADVRMAARRLAGQPGATLLTVVTLALSIGVAAAVFSVVDQLIFRPAPFLHADRLVDAWHLSGPNGGGGSQLPPRKILGWQEQTALFERFESYAAFEVDVTEAQEPERLSARVVSLGLFDMLGIKTQLGRRFEDGDGAPGSEKVVILGHAFWRSRFGGSLSVLGSRIVVNDDPHTIVGVLPHGTSLLTDDEPLWLPFDLRAWEAAPSMYGFYGIGRVIPSVNPDDAKVVADQIADRLSVSNPLKGSWYLSVRRKQVAWLETPTRQMLFVLLGAVGLLLLIACSNVTSFALAQTLKRRRELEVRAAIGASRWRLIREVLVETVLVAVAAGVAAVAVAYASLGVLLATAPDRIAHMTTRPIEVDTRVLAVMALATIAAGLLTGLLPAIRSSRADVTQSLKAGSRGSARGVSFGRGIASLVVLELALAMVLLVGTALMSRTLSAYYALEPGIDVERILTVELALPSHRYPTEQTRREFFGALDVALRSHPGIDATAFAWGIPPETGFGIGIPQAEGGPVQDEVHFSINYVSPEYFATTGTRILAGRAFTSSDSTASVIINEGFARKLWPEGSPIGRRYRESPDDIWLTVVGISGDVEARAGDMRLATQVYFPIALPPPGAVPPPSALRPPRSYASRALIVSSDTPSRVTGVIREQIRALDPNQPVGEFSLGTDLYAAPFAQQQFLLTVMGAFAVNALVLAAMGVFGVLSQAVTLRRREIGIRVALGAGHARLVRMLVGRGFMLAAVGAGLGTAASLAGVRSLESLLFGVSPFDPVSFAVVIVVLLATALVACWWPTRRALAVEPAEVLRSE